MAWHPGGMFILVLLIASVVVPIVMSRDYSNPGLLNVNLPPFWASAHGRGILGTDPLGRDLLLEIISAAKVSIGIGLLVTAIACVIGTSVGLLASILGRFFAVILMRIVDGFMSFPALLMAVTVLFVFGPGFWKLVAALALMNWPGYARVAYSDSLRTRQAAYITAARMASINSWRISAFYIFPSLRRPILALASVQVGGVILAESGLSFLGIGIQPPEVSWGLLISNGREYFPIAWWETLFPGLAIALAAAALNSWIAHISRLLDPLERGSMATVRADMLKTADPEIGM